MSQQSTENARITSQPEPLPDKKHESSDNFRFSNLPREGQVRVQIEDNSNAGSIAFVLWRNVNNSPDQEIRNNTGETRSYVGSIYDAKVLSEDANYFIGDPENAGGKTFVVKFVSG